MWNLPNGYSIREMDHETFDPLFQKHVQEMFDDVSIVFHLRDVLSEAEREKIKELKSLMGTPYTLRLGVFV